MRRPGSGFFSGHHEEVFNNLKHGRLFVFPDIVEEGEGLNVDFSFDMKFSKEKVISRNRRGGTQREKAPEHLIVK